MPRPSSLAFRLLDWRVVDGRADEIVARDGDRALSVAELLHESASVAGGLRALGVEGGTSIALDTTEPRLTSLVVVLAAVRLLAEPVPLDLIDTAPAFVVDQDGAVTHEHEVVDYLALRALGRNDPAAAAKVDPQGYAQRQLRRWPALLGALDDGRAVVLA